MKGLIIMLEWLIDINRGIVKRTWFSYIQDKQYLALHFRYSESKHGYILQPAIFSSCAISVFICSFPTHNNKKLYKVSPG